MRYVLILLRPEDLEALECPISGPSDNPTICIGRWGNDDDIIVDGNAGEEKYSFYVLRSEIKCRLHLIDVPCGSEVLIAVSHGNARNGNGRLRTVSCCREGLLLTSRSAFQMENHGLHLAIVVATVFGSAQFDELSLSANVQAEDWWALEQAVGTVFNRPLMCLNNTDAQGTSSTLESCDSTSAHAPAPDARSCPEPTSLLWLFGGVAAPENPDEAGAFEKAGGQLEREYADEGRSVIFFSAARRVTSDWAKKLSEISSASPAIMHHGQYREEVQLIGRRGTYSYSSGDRTYQEMLDDLNSAASSGTDGAVARCAWKWCGIYRRGVERDRIAHLVHRCVGPWSSLCLTTEDLAGRVAEGERRAVDALLSELREEWTRIPSAGPLGTLNETRRRVLGKQEKRTVRKSDISDRLRLFRAKGQTPWDDDIFNTGIYAALRRLAGERANLLAKDGGQGKDALSEVWNLLGVAVEISPIAEGGFQVSWKGKPGSWIARYTDLLQCLVSSHQPIVPLIEAHARDLAEGVSDLVAIEVNQKSGQPIAEFDTLRDWVDALVRAFEAAAAPQRGDEGGA